MKNSQLKKVLFVTSPYHCWGVQVAGNWPPLSLAYLAQSAREAGTSPEIYDAMNRNDSFKTITKKIKTYKPDFIVTYDYLPVTGAISTASVPDAIEILRIAKTLNSEIVTILGGPHPTFMFRDILEQEVGVVDIILLGEAEMAIKELLQDYSVENLPNVKGIAYLEDGVVNSSPAGRNRAPLDDLSVAWDLFDWDLYNYNVSPGGRMASIFTSRGCQMACSFCSHRLFYKGAWRDREPEKVIDEILFLVEKYQVKIFTLIDAYPTKNRIRWERFLDLLIDQNLDIHLLMETRVEDVVRDEDILHKYKKAGVAQIYVGAESGDDEVLSSINKGIEMATTKKALDLLRRNDIITEASFMIGFPEETWESIQKTINSAIELNPDIAVFPIVTPWPYTPLYHDMKERIRVFDYSKYNLVTPVIEPYNMTLDEVTEALGKCFTDFYSHKVKEVMALEDGFKKEYLMSAFKLMMKSIHGCGVRAGHKF